MKLPVIIIIAFKLCMPLGLMKFLITISLFYGACSLQVAQRNKQL